MNITIAQDQGKEISSSAQDAEKTIGSLRRLLFIQHGHFGASGSEKYFDDGELQCGLCMCDFKRDDPELIETKIRAYNLKQWNAMCNE
jgi:hypothetical protein